jgi:hypothetical protein
MNILHLLPLCSLVLMPAALFGAEPEDPTTAGSLRVILDRNRARELPLVHTDVRVEISAFVARTTVEQVFRDDLDEPVEAVYTFPLGDESAVDDFELQTGNQVVRGEIQRREAKFVSDGATMSSGLDVTVRVPLPPNPKFPTRSDRNAPAVQPPASE